MNGAESLFRTLIDAGVDVCFANPGTTEMPMVRALDEMPGMRSVLCLFEGVCAGAADGYARMSGKPGLTLLHLGPGFANGIAYLHDARRAGSAIVNLIGDHATWHLEADAPLTSDIESLARPVSAWVRRNRTAEELARDAADAVDVARTSPGRIATLIVPHDCQMEPAGGGVPVPAAAPPPRVGPEAVEKSASMLRGGAPSVLLLGGLALRERGLKAASRIAAATGCALRCETFPARWERGAGLPVVERLPYFPEQAIAALTPFRNVILAGAIPPVAFFGYPGLPSYLIPAGTNQLTLCRPDEDIPGALEALAERLGAPGEVETNTGLRLPPLPQGKITPESLSAVVAALMPENSIVMNEGNTSTAAFDQLSASSPRHTALAQPGGAIGLGMPCATGAAIACPDRPVITFQADGSAMYTLQALWTQARERLNVKTIICNNGSYRILGVELMRAGVREFGPQAQSLIGLGNPAIDWVSVSTGLGVPAVRVESAEALASEFRKALDEPGPRLIDAVL